MTEEIIIDGVDVAGCELFYSAYNENMCARVEGLTCGEDDNCYYKQLKRLEQENKELKAYKEVNEDFKTAWDELNKKYTEVLKLAKENADSNEYCLQELEKKNFALTQESQQKSQTICELKQENEVLTRENENRNDWITLLNKKCEELIKEKLNYCSALEEIQKAIKSYDLTVDNGASVDTLYTIRKIINEVLK